MLNKHKREKIGQFECCRKTNIHTYKQTLKENLPHKTCQIHVKPHLKNTQMTLECQIFD